jgi:(p)ppGpp synthase/HD superfamily hydrolase
MISTVFSTRLEAAIRRAAWAHRGQSRKGSDLPYLVHPFSVAMILDRLRFPEDVVIAGLLHDVVEDSGATLDEIGSEFGPDVALWVGCCSEAKTDVSGAKRPWIDRKRDYLLALRFAPAEAKAVALADKLHNLVSIRHDLLAGADVWSLFSAGRDDVLRFHHSAIEEIGHGEPGLSRLVIECREILVEIERNDGLATKAIDRDH